jgi:hypothetical protein
MQSAISKHIGPDGCRKKGKPKSSNRTISRSATAGQRMTDLGYHIIPLAFFICWVV